MSATKFCQSAPLEPVTVTEHRLEKKIKNIKRLKKSINNHSEKITYFKDENLK